MGTGWGTGWDVMQPPRRDWQTGVPARERDAADSRGPCPPLPSSRPRNSNKEWASGIAAKPACRRSVAEPACWPRMQGGGWHDHGDAGGWGRDGSTADLMAACGGHSPAEASA